MQRVGTTKWPLQTLVTKFERFISSDNLTAAVSKTQLRTLQHESGKKLCVQSLLGNHVFELLHGVG